ncbi:LysE family translocator [Pseudomonas syringae group genomosp. 3]|uniref:LysE family translocator n=1 Tax=Pseudomonas syringae group genomosp. 3 TaxID=251701 RepID=UPI000CF0DDD8|nr:LysE family translocator [Pseudomonas syringae group genomosp. 3]
MIVTVSLIMAFWAVSFLFVITPGVDWAYAISAGLRGRVLPAVFGMLCGHLVATLIVAAGVGGVLVKIPYALLTLTLMGAAYLLWLGFNMLLKPSLPVQGTSSNDGSCMASAIKGLCVSGLNPKVLLLFLALLPQFTDVSAAWPVGGQIVALGLIHGFSCGVVYLAVGYGAGAVLASRPAAAINVNRISGAAMIVIAVVLAAERLFT